MAVLLAGLSLALIVGWERARIRWAQGGRWSARLVVPD